MAELKELKILEGLASRKAAVYGRVLTDIALAGEMQELKEFHEERMVALASLLGEEVTVSQGDGNEA